MRATELNPRDRHGPTNGAHVFPGPQGNSHLRSSRLPLIKTEYQKFTEYSIKSNWWRISRENLAFAHLAVFIHF